jgi:hypothetical protein
VVLIQAAAVVLVDWFTHQAKLLPLIHIRLPLAAAELAQLPHQ